jgi:hypothetical protein
MRGGEGASPRERGSRSTPRETVQDALDGGSWWARSRGSVARAWSSRRARPWARTSGFRGGAMASPSTTSSWAGTAAQPTHGSRWPTRRSRSRSSSPGSGSPSWMSKPAATRATGVRTTASGCRCAISSRSARSPSTARRRRTARSISRGCWTTRPPSTPSPTASRARREPGIVSRWCVCSRRRSRAIGRCSASAKAPGSRRGTSAAR